MSSAFRQPDADGPGGKTDVWSDTAGSALFFAGQLNVNTDGTRRSYSVEDFWGKERAINNLCNAMSDACAGLTADQKRERREITQQALANGWPADELAKTKIASNVIPFKGGKPCPLVDGFLVSSTALFDSTVTDVCELSRYIDALEVPALVLPRGDNGFRQRNAKVGDLVVAVTSERIVYGVVGDLGPVGKLGEASVAMNGRLKGLVREPENYDDVRRNWVVSNAAVLVFPGTRDTSSPYLTNARIEAAAKEKLAAFGGEARLRKCAVEYAP